MGDPQQNNMMLAEEERVLLAKTAATKANYAAFVLSKGPRESAERAYRRALSAVTNSRSEAWDAATAYKDAARALNHSIYELGTAAHVENLLAELDDAIQQPQPRQRFQPYYRRRY